MAKLVDPVGRDFAVIGDRQQRQALVDVGLGDDLAVDDGGRFTTDGIVVPNSFGFSGNLSALTLLGAGGWVCGAVAAWAIAALAAPSPMTTSTERNRVRVEFKAVTN